MFCGFETKKALRRRIAYLEQEVKELKDKEKLRMDLNLGKCISRLCFACAHGVFAQQDENMMPFLAGCAKNKECKDFVNATTISQPYQPFPNWRAPQ